MTDDVKKIDLNLADEASLTTLSGIGTALAKRIIEYRENVHPFEEVIELTAVPGISERLVRSFQDRVKVSIPAQPEMVEGEAKDSEAEELQATVVEEVESVEHMEEEELEPLPEPVVLEEPEASLETEEAAEEEVSSPEESEETAGGEGVEEPVQMSEEEPFELADVPPPPVSSFTARDRIEDVRPVSISEPETVSTAPSEPSPSHEKAARRRGCVAIILGAFLGAAVGTILTLAILAALNDFNLSFSQADARLRRGLNEAQQAQTDLDNQIDSLDAQVKELITQTEELAVQQEEIGRALNDYDQAITGIQRDVTTLEETTVDMDERLSGVAAAAET